MKFCSYTRLDYSSARPFKHLVIDDFFDNSVAEALLNEFPSFDQRFATNEFGEIGGKAVRSNLAEISESYAKLYDHITSSEFLEIISRITGIPKLLADPEMYGGGTHENLHHQELDPHVDFNYDQSGCLHRRLNALIYLSQQRMGNQLGRWNRASFEPTRPKHQRD